MTRSDSTQAKVVTSLADSSNKSSTSKRSLQMKSLNKISRSNQGGFSLVELTIVVVILGVLAMMGVPRYQQVVERTKASEAFTYLAQIEATQERYNAVHGEYAQRISDLDTEIPTPNHFSIGTLTSYDWQTQWELRLTRSGPSSGFGNYTVTWNQDGFTRYRSSLAEELIPVL
jgi:prepilin-type N-terminal cleavage/methylation domain-containing protein